MVDAAPRMGLFERYLTLWVGLCIVAGTGLGHVLPGAPEDALADLADLYIFTPCRQLIYITLPEKRCQISAAKHRPRFPLPCVNRTPMADVAVTLARTSQTC